MLMTNEVSDNAVDKVENDSSFQLYDFTTANLKIKFTSLDLKESIKDESTNQPLDKIPFLTDIYQLYNKVTDTVKDGVTKLVTSPLDPIHQYRKVMENATTYEQWATAACTLDQLEGKDAWKQDPQSKIYDYELIYTRLNQLRKARSEKDINSLIYLLRTSMSRNFGDTGKPELYAHTNYGTKVLIERYFAEVVRSLHFLSSIEDESFDLKAKYDFFLNTRQAYGRTALLLSGGSTLGTNHIGIYRALCKAKLLPRIISGASSGSIIASLICSRTDEELDAMIVSGEVTMDVFEDFFKEGALLNMVSRLLKRGVLFDVSALSHCIKGLTGDLTFNEAYNKTRRILNIPVSSSTEYEMPRLLNYVTAPNVLIWSAVVASCAVPFIFEPTQIYCKDRSGKVMPWNPTGSRWIDGSVENDLPMNKLSEMFNVNHFIVCQVNPHVVPFLSKKPSTTTIQKAANWSMHMVRSELQHRLNQMSEMGIFRGTTYMMQAVLSQKYRGDITIIPDLTYVDFLRIFVNPSPDDVFEALGRGERAIWPKLAIIRNHCQVELSIDAILYDLRFQLFQLTNEPSSTSPPEDSRLKVNGSKTLPRSASSAQIKSSHQRFSLTQLKE